MTPDRDRILHDLETLSSVGTTTSGGVTRLAYTSAERQAHDVVSRWMADLGLSVVEDHAGNTFGVRRRDGMTVLIGSHLDTVPEGGRFDGAAGVVCAIEVARLLAREGWPVSAFGIVAFAAEEGARFGRPLLGSSMAAGLMAEESLDTIKDSQGMTLRQAMHAVGIGGGPTVADRLRPLVYLELHVEQGSVLEEQTVKLGVVQGASGVCRLRVSLDGRGGHSGTAPMENRSDSLAAAAEIILQVEASATSTGQGSRGTVGAIRVSPNVVNALARQAVLEVDLRATQEEALSALQDRVIRAVRTVARRREVDARVEQIMFQQPIELDPAVRELLEGRCRVLGEPYRTIWSYAAHDAMAMAAIGKTGMLFVPSRGGISHHPDEWSDARDIELGALVLKSAVISLDERLRLGHDSLTP